MGGCLTDARNSSATTPDQAGNPSVTPQDFGQADHSFTLQAVMELQKSTGQLISRVESLKDVVEKQESRGNGHHTRKTDKKMEASVEARHSCERKPVIPAKAGIQKMELIEKSNPEWVDSYGELV